MADMPTLPISRHIDGFIAARRYAPTSAMQRRSVIRTFARATGDPRPSELSPVLCLDWWAGLGGKPPATASSYLAAVRAFLAHLSALGLIEGDPLRAIVPPKVPTADPIVLTAAEVRAVIAGATPPRTRAIVALMLGCGLRGIDISRLRVEHLDMVDGVMRVHGKGGKVADVPMPREVIDAVTDYLTERPATTGPLIRQDSSEEGLRAGWIRALVADHLAAIGVKRSSGDGRSGHVLRRTFATTLIEHGASIRDVQILLRHDALSSTERYLRRPDAHRLRSVVEQGPYAA